MALPMDPRDARSFEEFRTRRAMVHYVQDRWWIAGLMALHFFLMTISGAGSSSFLLVQALFTLTVCGPTDILAYRTGQPTLVTLVYTAVDFYRMQAAHSLASRDQYFLWMGMLAYGGLYYVIGVLRVPFSHGCAFILCHVASWVLQLTQSRFGFTLSHALGFAAAILAYSFFMLLRTVRVDFELYTEFGSRRAAERQKASFISYIMHEIRNPLQAATLMVQELDATVRAHTKAEDATGDADSAATTQTLVHHVLDQLQNMAQVCDEVLQLERLEAGRLQLNLAPFALGAWVKDLHHSNRLVFDMKRLRLTLQLLVPPALDGALVVADGGRLRQVVTNLLSNARKFTKEGGEVALTVELHEAEPSSIPIQGETSAQLKADTGSSRHACGFSLAARTLHGGRLLQLALGLVWAARLAVRCLGLKPGKAPLPEPARPQADPGQPAGWSAWLRVSVRDTGVGLSPDDLGKLFRPYSQIRAGELQQGGGTGLGLCFCKAIVEKHGGRIAARSQGPGLGADFSLALPVQLTSDPTSADATPKRPAAGTVAAGGVPSRHSSAMSTAPSAPDAASGTRGSPQPAVVLRSGGSMRQRRRLGNSSGRLSTDTLAACGTPTGSSLGDASPGPLPSLTASVLIVDDSDICRLALELMLQRLGISFQSAKDGQEAVDRMTVSGETYRLVLMDRDMPRMQGPDAVRVIRQYYASRPPAAGCAAAFVGLTGMVGSGATDEFNTAGADGVYAKPLTREQISKLLDHYLYK